MILSLAQIRAHIETDLGDTALQALIDAAEEDILQAYGQYAPISSGDPETVEEIITPRGFGPLLMLSRRAADIVEIIELTTTLAADDYELRSSGRTLRRLSDGTNPATYWRGRVYVTYEPLSESASRERVQIALVELDVNTSPGSQSERIGDWSETQSQGASDYVKERSAILASLRPSEVAIW